jgi:hypothetical protein
MRQCNPAAVLYLTPRTKEQAGEFNPVRNAAVEIPPARVTASCSKPANETGPR